MYHENQITTNAEQRVAAVQRDALIAPVPLWKIITIKFDLFFPSLNNIPVLKDIFGGHDYNDTSPNSYWFPDDFFFGSQNVKCYLFFKTTINRFKHQLIFRVSNVIRTCAAIKTRAEAILIHATKVFTMLELYKKMNNNKNWNLFRVLTIQRCIFTHHFYVAGYLDKQFEVRQLLILNIPVNLSYLNDKVKV